jgi:hypothetical protein
MAIRADSPNKVEPVAKRYLRDSENIKILFLVGCAVRTVAVNANDSGSLGDVRMAHPTQTSTGSG